MMAVNITENVFLASSNIFSRQIESSVSMWAGNLKQATGESLKNQFIWLKFMFNLIKVYNKLIIHRKSCKKYF